MTMRRRWRRIAAMMRKENYEDDDNGDDDDDDNDDVDDSTRSIAIEGSYASVLHGNRLRWPFDLGRVWWSKDMRGILFFSGGNYLALFFFHCRSGGKKERDGVLIFLVRVISLLLFSFVAERFSYHLVR